MLLRKDKAKRSSQKVKRLDLCISEHHEAGKVEGEQLVKLGKSKCLYFFGSMVPYDKKAINHTESSIYLMLHKA